MSSDALAMDLAEAAVARLCHDLGGSIGAIINGLELAAGHPDLAAEAQAIAGDAAREAAARLRFARALWHLEGGLEIDDLTALARGLPNAGRLELDRSGLCGAALPRPAARLLLACLLTAAEALHGPGVIALAGDTTREIVVMIDGPRAAWPEDLAALAAAPALAGGGVSARNVAARAAVLLAAQAGARLSFLLAGMGETPPPLLVSLRG